MKKIIYLFTSLLLIALTSACTDRSTFNNPATYQLERGAFVRFVEVPPTSFVPEEAQTINISEEVFDANGNVSLYELSVEVSLTSTGLTYIGNNFLTIDTFPSTLNITSQMIADAIGVDVALFGAGDFVAFTAVATRNDGVKFFGIEPTYDADNGTIGVGNTDGQILNSPAYTDAMNFNYVLACPIDNALYVGAYSLVAEVGDCQGVKIFNDQAVDLQVVSVYQRSFQARYIESLGIGQGPMTFVMDLICGTVTASDNQATNLGCSGSLLLGSSATPGPYSETDDSVLEVPYVENCAGCGGDPAWETVLTLTKI